jgi:hypothetical protein
MHRFRILVAGALVTAVPLVTNQIAFASPTRAASGSSSSFCATAQQLQGDIQDLGNLDLEKLSVSSVKSTYRRDLKLVKQLQKQAPNELKAAFKRLRALYQRVVDGKVKLDVTSSRSVEKFSKALAKAGDDLSRIFSYLEDQCGITFESPTTTT